MRFPVHLTLAVAHKKSGRPPRYEKVSAAFPGRNRIRPHTIFIALSHTAGTGRRIPRCRQNR